MSSLDTRSEQRLDGAGCGITWLDGPGADDAGLVGAKAANLAVAARAGLAVLPGFVITTQCTPRLAPGAELPPALHIAWAALTEGGERALVVRSSSVVEDGTSSSMAGRFESVLDVRGWTEFLVAVRRVVDSGAVVSAAGMAVLVQPMLTARLGGVMFGVDPVSGRRDRLVVAAVDGGPDRLVSGLVPGTHYELTKRGRTRSVQGDGTHLSARLRQQLARLAARTEVVFGGPQDIEWAVDGGGRLVLLQSRPVTTVGAAEKAHGPRFGPGPVAETLPGVLSPLEQDLWVEPLRDGLVEALRLAGATTRRTLAASPVVTVVDGQVAADLDLLGVPGRRSFWRRLDPRPPARRTVAAWRVGRLRAAVPVLADDLIGTTDRLLLDVPALDDLAAEQLLESLHRSRQLLVALHGQEVLAGLLLGPGSGTTTGAGAALAALAAGRARGVDDEEIVAAEPVVLALLPPRIGGDLTALAAFDRAAVAPVAAIAVGAGTFGIDDGGDDAALHREALRLRARWVQELTARSADRLGVLLAERGDLPDATLVRHLRLAELAAVVAGRPAPTDLAARAAPVTTAPLPAAFTLDPDGHPVALRGDGRGRGAGGGRGVGPVVHGDGTSPPPSGSVLVVRTLDPSLAPHLGRLAGLVAETGSVLSHLAILARESGVPTAVGVDDAMGRLPEGAIAYVDGTTGDTGVVDNAAAELRQAS